MTRIERPATATPLQTKPGTLAAMHAHLTRFQDRKWIMPLTGGSVLHEAVNQFGGGKLQDAHLGIEITQWPTAF